MLYNIFTLAFAFLVLVSFHELGHYLAAKWAGVKVHKFALGFPPWIFSIKLGETVYCMGMTLMGGFVRMQGEEMIVGEGENLDDRDYRKKPIWKRAIIILAGPVFSLALALPITMYCLSSGLLQPPPIIGAQPAGSPFLAAGLLPGDRVVEMDGTPIYHRTSMLMHLYLNNKTSPVRVTVLRDDGLGNQVRVEGTLLANPDGFDFNSAGSLFRAGLDQPLWRVGVDVQDEGFHFRQVTRIQGIQREFAENKPTPASRTDLKAGDEIVAINGQPISSFTDLLHYVTVHGAKPLTLQVRQAAAPEKIVDVEIQAVNLSDEGQTPDYKLGIGGETQYEVTAVRADSPAAKAGLSVGMWMTIQGTSGEQATFRSQATENPLDPTTGERYTDTDQLYIETGFAADVPFYFYPIAARETWRGMAEKISKKENPPPVKFSLRTVAGSLTQRLNLAPVIPTVPQPLPATLSGGSGTHFELLDDRAEYQQVRGMGNLAQATWGDFNTQLYRMLQSLKKIAIDIFSGDRKALGGLAGPLGIGGMLWNQGNMSGPLAFNKYLMFIGFISINLGIMNLLPIPILDGGHLMMMGIEAIRRKPPSRVLVERFQIVGLVLLLGLFLLATGMDIYHLFFPR